MLVCPHHRLPRSSREGELLVPMPAWVSLQRVRSSERSHNAECLHLSKIPDGTNESLVTTSSTVVPGAGRRAGEGRRVG